MWDAELKVKVKLSHNKIYCGEGMKWLLYSNKVMMYKYLSDYSNSLSHLKKNTQFFVRH